MSLEEEFGTEISDEDAERIRTVGDAVEYIDERNQPKPAGSWTGPTSSQSSSASPSGIGASWPRR